uniref:Uncharacterized protein n=1 Tax=Anopheles maculatus TaxID=74869 RepID=A0A182T3C2_9DIPT
MARPGRWEMLKIIAHLAIILLLCDTWRTVESKAVAGAVSRDHRPASPEMQPNDDIVVLHVDEFRVMSNIDGDKLVFYTESNAGRTFVFDRHRMECHELVELYTSLLPVKPLAVSKEEEEYLRHPRILCRSAQGSSVKLAMKDGLFLM